MSFFVFAKLILPYLWKPHKPFHRLVAFHWQKMGLQKSRAMVCLLA